MKAKQAPSKPFHKINLEISNICNLHCSFCPEVSRPKGFMEVSLFRKVIEQVAPLTEQVCFHLMGEPLVHPRLRELVEICHEKGVRIFLVTNGVLLREFQTETLLHPAFRQVNFSLHSFPDNFGDQDSSRNPARNLARYLEKIFHFTERAFQERPELFINYRLWNLSSPQGTGERNRDLLQRIAEHFRVAIPSDLPGLDIRRKKSIRLLNRLYLHFDTEFTWPSLDLPLLGERGTCYGLSSHFGILVDGTVVPCCLDKEGAIPLGNADERPITEILETPRAKEILRGFREGRLVEDLCKRCQYIQRFT